MKIVATLTVVMSVLLSVSCGGDSQPPASTKPAVETSQPLEIRSTPAVAEQAAETTIAAELAQYERTAGISGNLSSIGSDTLANLMTLWTESFKKHYPSVNIQVQAAGSSTAPPALTEGTSNFGPMSRAMKDKEIEAFETRHGYKPTPMPGATVCPRPAG